MFQLHQTRPSPVPSLSDQKRGPNYLRSTLSSAPYPSTHSSNKTKQTSTTHIQKPATLNRRRSFDKPPPNSRLNKTHTPTPTPTDQKINLQSSSSLLVPKRSSSLPKSFQKEEPVHKKNAGKSHSLYARPTGTTVKKMSTHVSKKQNNPSTIATASSTSSSPEDIAYLNECQLQEDLESSPAPITDQVRGWVDQESNNIKLPVDDIPILEEEKQEKKQHKDLIKSSTVSEEDQNQTRDVQMEEAEAEAKAELVPSPIEETNKVEINESHVEKESSAGKSAVEGYADGEKKKKKTKKRIMQLKSQETTSLWTRRRKNWLMKEVFATCPEEADHHQCTPELTKPEKGKGKVHHSQGKAYNEVIEETASKLIVEKRKNKVKALGAFETVISLQDQQHLAEET
ncbi:plant calmodulin-binding protein-like protein [Actinidia rufa]|uniref:Plant calmodulin-binding protein-like protein n=1 Tax=Actinidia rufa TaxID=165716 RepID=A0A7J0FDG3_9ERIC|nr:plant calmodulin-binding protein-like protein [Actinidia rufa]